MLRRVTKSPLIKNNCIILLTLLLCYLPKPTISRFHNFLTHDMADHLLHDKWSPPHHDEASSGDSGSEESKEYDFQPVDISQIHQKGDALANGAHNDKYDYAKLGQKGTETGQDQVKDNQLVDLFTRRLKGLFYKQIIPQETQSFGEAFVILVAQRIQQKLLLKNPNISNKDLQKKIEGNQMIQDLIRSQMDDFQTFYKNQVDRHLENYAEKKFQEYGVGSDQEALLKSAANELHNQLFETYSSDFKSMIHEGLLEVVMALRHEE